MAGRGRPRRLPCLERRFPASPRLTSTRQSLDTAGSALTGRHQPAAREHSHLFGLSRVRVHLLSAWFQRGTGDQWKRVAMTTSKSLPARPSLESLRKQAKKLARDIDARDTDAIARAQLQLPNIELPLTQRNAQLVIAREYGFPGWQDLTAEVRK